jgi:hypothetical protein
MSDTNYIAFDSLFSSTQTPYFDEDGILISLSNGGYLNVYATDSANSWVAHENGTWIPKEGADSALVNITEASEPSSLLLLGSGLLFLAGLLFWKARPNLAKAA